jgi:hypothetical protein
MLYKHATYGVRRGKYQLQLGRGIAQVDSGVLPTAATRVRTQFFKHVSSVVQTGNYQLQIGRAIAQ